MLRHDVEECSFSKWYHQFKDITIPSDIISLPTEVKDYLLSDGIILPKSCQIELDEARESSSEYEDEVQDDEDSINDNVPDFPEFESEIRSSIAKYGFVFPKLNWSSCEDAKWIQGLGSKCSTLSDVFLLLKSSDKVVHDLTQAIQHCLDFNEANEAFNYDLILREWRHINPSMEFRCFIARNQLIGICQRDVRSFYEHIGQQKNHIIEDIEQFFCENFQNRFSIDSLVLDLYRPTNNPNDIVLIDINPFGEYTDSLLFDWDELKSRVTNDNGEDFSKDFRFIESQFGVQPQRLEMNSLPLDVFNGNLDPSVFQDQLIKNGH